MVDEVLEGLRCFRFCVLAEIRAKENRPCGRLKADQVGALNGGQDFQRCFVVADLELGARQLYDR